MRNNYIFQNKKLVRRMALLHIAADLFNVQFNRKGLHAHTCLCNLLSYDVTCSL